MLNLEVAGRIDAGRAVVAPGIPPDYPNPKKLVTDSRGSRRCWRTIRLAAAWQKFF